MKEEVDIGVMEEEEDGRGMMWRGGVVKGVEVGGKKIEKVRMVVKGGGGWGR